MAQVLQAEDIVLVENNQAKAVIIVGDSPLPIPIKLKKKVGKRVKHIVQNQGYAAQELQKWIEKSTGAKLEIMAAANAPKTGTLILVGASSLSKEFGLKTPVKSEGLLITHFPRGIAILGEIAPKGTNNVSYEIDRGVLHGVYEFLERIVGCRWYFVDYDDPELGYVVPKLKNLAVAANYSFSTAPDFPHREGGALITGLDSQKTPLDYAINRPGAGTGFFANHTDENWGKLYRKISPKQFVLNKDGTRDLKRVCYSAPETLAQRTKIYKEYFAGKRKLRGRQKPSEKYAPFVIVDNYHSVCYSKDCIKYFNLNAGVYGRNSEIIFRHTNGFAKAVKKMKPGMRVATLSYSYYMLPPKVEIEDNIDVMVATMWSTQLNKEEYWYKRNIKLMKDWSKKLGDKKERLYAWTYACWPWGDVPRLFPRSQQRWLKDLYGVMSGEFINPGQANGIGHYMNNVWFKLLWNRNLDLDANLKDYCEKFYGPTASKPMLKFFKLCIDRWENTKWSFELPTWYIPAELTYGETYTAEVMAKLHSYFDEAKAVSSKDKNNIYARRLMWLEKELGSFFKRAKYSHKWLKKQKQYTVKTISESLKNSVDWQNVPEISLVKKVLGDDPEYATKVQIVQKDKMIHVRFQAEDKTKPKKGDSLTLEFRDKKLLSLPIVLVKNHVELSLKFPRGIYVSPKDKKQYLEILPDGMILGNLDAALVSKEYKNKIWTVHLKFPAKMLKTAEFATQIKRMRALRKKEDKDIVARHKTTKPKPRVYLWMPQLDPTSWPEMSVRYRKMSFTKTP